MNYNPKLKMAMEEIKTILAKYEIGAVVALHLPGFTEYLLKIDPPYSVAKWEGNNIRIKSTLENFANKEEQGLAINNTVNMLVSFRNHGTVLQDAMKDVLNMVQTKIKFDEHDGGQTSHIQQNN